MDTMASYPNTPGLLVAHALVNNNTSVCTAPVIKATARDSKKYMKLRNQVTGQRVLPIGYSAAASGARDMTILDYLSSGDTSGSIDFWTVSSSGT